ncbi:hypothetical protein [Streptomyces sp. NPDC048612]|uniref:hypothetical protein n=1 Tax=Streptomyces sp. NPDC048612 TaxID=3365579 RepID=UPI00371754CF
MRTARTLFASAVLTAMFAVAGPTATAASAVENHTTDHTASSSSAHDHDRCKHGHKRDHHKKDHRRKHHKKNHHKRDHHRWDHHRPSGGVHTGGGGLMDFLR